MSKKKPVRRTIVADAVFNYTSVCCKSAAKKPALVRTEEKQGSLGHWRCCNCERSTRVTRSRVKNETTE